MGGEGGGHETHLVIYTWFHNCYGYDQGGRSVSVRCYVFLDHACFHVNGTSNSPMSCTS